MPITMQVNEINLTVPAVVVSGILVTNKPLKTTSTIDKDIMLNNSPMKFNVPGKLVVPRINRNNEVENTGYMLNLVLSLTGIITMKAKATDKVTSVKQN